MNNNECGSSRTDGGQIYRQYNCVNVLTHERETKKLAEGRYDLAPT